MVKILGIGDLIVTALLLATAFKVDVPLEMLISFSIYLFFKALIAITDVGSLIDIGVVVLLVLSIFITIPSIILFIAAALLGLKGIISLFS